MTIGNHEQKIIKRLKINDSLLFITDNQNIFKLNTLQYE
jgi:hypothetical protein